MKLRHYGKEVKNLTDMEIKLLSIDNEIFEIFNLLQRLQSGSSSTYKSLFSISDDLSKERIRLSMKLLNLKVEDFGSIKEMLIYIEESNYGFGKFLMNMKENTMIMSDEVNIDFCMN